MIFVDRSGWRRRFLMVLGLCIGLLLLSGLFALTAAALIDSPVRPPWPDPVDR